MEKIVSDCLAVSLISKDFFVKAFHLAAKIQLCFYVNEPTEHNPDPLGWWNCWLCTSQCLLFPLFLCCLRRKVRKSLLIDV